MNRVNGEVGMDGVVEPDVVDGVVYESYLYSYCTTFDLDHRKATTVVVLYEKAKCIFPALLRNIISSIIVVQSG